MNSLVLMDAGPLGLVTNPGESDQSRRCKAWLRNLLASGARVLIPEIADYEVRRELIRADRRQGLARLDALAEELDYLPITTRVMRLAAGFWAEARKGGWPTADDKALDADAILAAQAILAGEDGIDVFIATTNPGHLGRFVDGVRLWDTITMPNDRGTVSP